MIMYNKEKASSQSLVHIPKPTNSNPYTNANANDYKPLQSKGKSTIKESLANADIYLKDLLSAFLAQINPDDEQEEEQGVILTTQHKINQSRESMRNKGVTVGVGGQGEIRLQSLASTIQLSKLSNDLFSQKDRDKDRDKDKDSDRSSTRQRILETNHKRGFIETREGNKKKSGAKNQDKDYNKDKDKESISSNLIKKKKTSPQRYNSINLRRKTELDMTSIAITMDINKPHKKKSSISIPHKRKSYSSLKALRHNGDPCTVLDDDHELFTPKPNAHLSNDKPNPKNELDIQNVRGLTKANIVELERICQELKINICNTELGNINNELASSLKDYPELRKAEKKSYANDIVSSLCPSSKSSKEHKYRCLLHKKYVYDSLDDEEIEDEIDVSYVIPSTSRLIILFDFFVFGTVMSNYIYTPYSLAFNYSTHRLYPYTEQVFEFVFDILLTIDIFLRFIRTYTTIDDETILHLPLIATHYLFSWCLFDVITSLPFNSYIVYKHNRDRAHNDIVALDYYMPHKLIQLLRLIRMLKMINVLCINEFLKRAYKKFIHIHHFSQWSRLYLSTITFLVTVHILASVFIFIGKLNYPSWLSIRKQSQSQGAIYIDAVYYIFSSIYSIGYGDVVSISFSERIFNLFLLIFGVMLYSWGLSSISTYVQTLDAKTIDYNNKLSILEDIKLNHANMPDELYDKVCRFLYYRKRNEKKDKTAIVDSLPIGLRNNLIFTMYKPIIENFTFFKNFDNTEFIVRIILALRPIYGLKHDILVKEGDFIEEIIFVKRGNLSLQLPLPDLSHLDQRRTCCLQRNLIMNPRIKESLINLEKYKLSYYDGVSGSIRNSGIGYDSNVNHNTNANGNGNANDDDLSSNSRQYIKIMEIRSNEHFGDVLMFLNRRSPLTMKVKSKVVDMFYLKKTDAVEISMGYPSIWHTINKKSLFNMEQIDRLINKAIKLFFLSNQRQLNALIREKNKRPSLHPQKEIMKSKKIAELYAIVNNNSSELKSIPSKSYTESNMSENIINMTEEGGGEGDGEGEGSGMTIENNKTYKRKDKDKSKDVIVMDEIIEERDSENTIEMRIEDEGKIMKNAIMNYSNCNSIGRPDSNKISDETELTHLSFDDKEKSTSHHHCINTNNSNTNSDVIINRLRMKPEYSITYEIHSREAFTIQSSYSNLNEYNNNNITHTIELMNHITQMDPYELKSILNRRKSSKTVHIKVPPIHMTSNAHYNRSNSYEALISARPRPGPDHTIFRHQINKVFTERSPEERTLLNQKELSKWKFNQAKTNFLLKSRTDVSEESSGKVVKIYKKSSLVDKLGSNANGNNGGGGGKTQHNLNKIKENIEMNALNLNNPDLFYAEYFQKVMNKEQNILARQELIKRLDYTEKMICEHSSSNESHKKTHNNNHNGNNYNKTYINK